MTEETVKINCEACSVTFTTKSNLSRHNRRFHHASKIEHVVCPEDECSYKCARMSLLESHLAEVHGKELEKECLHFRTANEFMAWKSNVEQDELAKYILRKKRKHNECYVLRCHRSGNPERSKSMGKRPRKKGTIKIGRTCPSRMKVFETKMGVDVMYVKTHLGHDKENLFLRRRKVIDDTLCVNDLLSVDTLIQNWKDMGDESVIFYKPVGIADAVHPSLSKADFALVVMNNVQEKIQKNYQKEVACLDVLNMIGPSQLYLNTLVIVDNEAFPIAFFFSNGKEQKHYDFFFNIISVHIGRIVTKVFMSDNQVCYDAWTNIMGYCDKNVLCSWNVQQMWQKQLSNITDGSIKVQLRKELYNMLVEPDMKAFQDKFFSLMQKLETDPLMQPFKDYFIQNFSNCTEQWAWCFQFKGNLHHYRLLEKMHIRLKKLCYRHKFMKHLDAILNDLRNFRINQHGCKLNAFPKQRKLTIKDLSMRTNHIKSFDGSFSFIRETVEGNYYVSSFTQTFAHYYTVTTDVLDCDCENICQDCKICMHRFKCSCVEDPEMPNMCKHIHLVGRYLFETRNLIEHNYAYETSGLCTLSTEGEVPNIQLELEIHNTDVTDIGPEILVQSEKQNVLSLVQELKEHCMQMQSLEELLMMKNNLKIIMQR